MNTGALSIFAAVVVATLLITWRASRRNRTAADHYVAGGKLGGWQNGLAITGDFVSAAAFLGISGAIALGGFDGYYTMLGVPLGFCLMLFLVAGPLRNLGRYTLADVLTGRSSRGAVRGLAAVNTLFISLVYMVAQFVGAGGLVSLLTGMDYRLAVLGIGVLMTIYITLGGMLATTWIQILKASLLLLGTLALVVLTVSRFGFSPDAVFAAVEDRLLRPSEPHGAWAAVDLFSLNLSVGLGIAGLPHLLIRFLTVPDAGVARRSVITSGVFTGLFGLALPIVGYGAAALVGTAALRQANSAGNLAAPQLAEVLGGEVFLGFIAAVAFATIVAVLAGLVIATSGAVAHDLYATLLRRGRASERSQLRAAQVTSFMVCVVSMLLALGARGLNLAFLISLGLAVAAATNLPVLLCTVYWRRFTSTGAISGIVVGLGAAVVLTVLSPSVLGAAALVPLTNPAVFCVPAGFLACWLGTMLGPPDRNPGMSFDEVQVRAAVGDPARLAGARG
ncbi:cation acetate symporter [Pseudonocardia sp. ICBG1034]|uniref:solute symporter family protein n=1 Tax=Pseudonocardia sp. ICBG1034 TaxID=2844381 RepID=UPI001CCACB44|nr:cation acetate symporter [Pseudonocardia sp. ICBG1034]